MSKSPPYTLGMLFPGPEPVQIGDQAWLVSELRLCDIAALERAIGRTLPGPLADLPSEASDPDPPTRKRRLREARDRAANCPPAWGSRPCQEALCTFRGAATYLHVVLGIHNKIDDEVAYELAGTMTAAEWEAVERVAWGVDALEAVYRVGVPALMPPPSESAADWGKALVALVAKGIPPDRAGRLTLRQVNCLLGDGVRMELRPEPACPDESPTGDPFIDRHNSRMRFWYELDELERTDNGFLILKKPAVTASTP